jgi:hypothetical protein
MDDLALLQVRTIERILGTPLARGILAGEPDRTHYIGYLVNVFHYARHSAQVIALAGSRCVESHPALAEYYFRHAGEELGHERWALSDLADLDLPEKTVRESAPAPSCAAMIGLEYYAAGHGNPVSLLGWMRVLESLGDDLGHRIAGLIDRGLAKDRAAPKGSAFLRGHGDADREHIKEIDRQIAACADSPLDMRDILVVARASADLYVHMLEEIVAEGVRWA